MAPRLFWIDAPLKGRIAIVSRPLGGERLNEEIAALKAEGLDALVSLLEPGEAAELGLTREADICALHGIAFYAFPIADRGLPGDAATFAILAQSLANRVANREAVAVHCRAGIGRSSLAAASILVCGGVAAEETAALLSRARGLTVPDTDAQRAWIYGLPAIHDG
ncbi:MAG: hypothetical protein WDN03_06875 [Rhizomicrobium sp.]